MAGDRISPEELAALVAATEAAAKAWVAGDPHPYLDLVSQTPDFTIAGPFGGPAVIGHDAYRQGALLAAQTFRGGRSALKVVGAHASGDLVVLILEEEQSAEIAGTETPWSLRVTQVYRREPQGWRVVHRHADPLVLRRSVAEAVALARD